MTEAWDALIDAIENALSTPGLPAPSALEPLVAAAIDERAIDAELDPAATARLLVALADGTRRLEPTEVDIATALMVVTRWLHPPRLGARREAGPAI